MFAIQHCAVTSNVDPSSKGFTRRKTLEQLNIDAVELTLYEQYKYVNDESARVGVGKYRRKSASSGNAARLKTPYARGEDNGIHV